MRTLRKYIIPAVGVLVVLMCVSFLYGCGTEEPVPGPKPDSDESPSYNSATIIYAVASNSLQDYLNADMNEIKSVASSLDLAHNAVLLYSVTHNTPPRLSVLSPVADGGYDFVEVKEYTRDVLSSDPARIAEAIGDALDYARAPVNGLILWSHASSWSPEFSDHRPRTAQKRAFGQDNTNGANDWCDLLELASAIPGDKFQYIWFDCCYMGAVEVVYELKDKCDFIVGYPTETLADGMPYDLTMPYLVGESPNLIKAAQEYSDYYGTEPHTIGVYDTDKFGAMANAYSPFGNVKGTSRITAHNYGRYSNGPYYDLGQMAEFLGADQPQAVDAVKKALGKAVIFKSASPRDFSNKIINPDSYSGISVHYIYDPGTKADETAYYKTLSWYKATTKGQ